VTSGAAPPRHRRLRRAGLVLLALLLAAGAVLLSLSFFSARDKPSVEAVAGPGAVHPDRGDRILGAGGHTRPGADGLPPTSGPHARSSVSAQGRRLTDDQLLTALAAGNVVLLYDAPRPPAALSALATSVAGGPFDAALAQSGQAVILGRRPGTRGVLALAWRHSLAAPPAGVRDLRAFTEFWLGRGAG